MKACVRWNKNFGSEPGKPWRVLFDGKEIFCDQVIFPKGGYSQTIEISEQDFRSHMCAEINRVINENGIVRLE